MKKICLCVAVAAIAASVPALAADLGVSINVGEPGFYGQIDIGDVPRPALIYPQPVIIQPAPAGVVMEPMYLRVPPGHARHWREYCGRYNACGRPVYFVQDHWYKNVYAPHYRREHADRGYRGNGHHPGEYRDEEHGRRGG